MRANKQLRSDDEIIHINSKISEMTWIFSRNDVSLSVTLKDIHFKEIKSILPPLDDSKVWRLKIENNETSTLTCTWDKRKLPTTFWRMFSYIKFEIEKLAISLPNFEEI